MIINGKKYITGVFRGDSGEKMVTHLYEGPFHSPGNPMCSNGWHRKYFDEHGNLVDWEYSIFRNNWTSRGVCAVCERRAIKGLPGLDKPKAKYNPRLKNHIKY